MPPKSRYREAAHIIEALDSPIDKRLVTWLIARAPESGLTAEQILSIRDSHAGWPEPEQLEFRAEQAFLKTLPSSTRTLEFFRGREPATQAGRIALASAYF